MTMNFGEIIMCDRFGIIWDGNPDNNEPQQEMAKVTNKKLMKGTLADAVKGLSLIHISRAGSELSDDVRYLYEDLYEMRPEFQSG